MAARKKEQTITEQTVQDMGQTPAAAENITPERDEFAVLPSPCVYCGPSVRGVARQYTTYMGGLPDALKEFVKEHPAARGLIVPIARFASVRKRLETPGTAESAIYRKLKSEL